MDYCRAKTAQRVGFHRDILQKSLSPKFCHCLFPYEKYSLIFPVKKRTPGLKKEGGKEEFFFSVRICNILKFGLRRVIRLVPEEDVKAHQDICSNPSGVNISLF